MPQPGGCRAFGALPHAQVLGQPDQHRSHQERLVPVVADVLDLEHDVAASSLAKSRGWPPSRNRPVGAQAQAGQIRTWTKPRTLSVTSRAVADLVDHALGRCAAGRPGRGSAARRRDGGLAGDQVPAGVLVAAGQRGRQDLRERLVGLEGGQEQRPDQVGVGLQREPGPPGRRGSSGLIPAGGASRSPGRIRMTRVPGSRAAISRYSALAGSITSHGMPARWPPPAGPDGLRLAGAGGPAHERVPVEAVGADPHVAHGRTVPVEQLAQMEAADALLGGDVERGAQRLVDARDLLVGPASERGDQRRAGQEERVPVREHLGERAGRRRGRERVRQTAQVGRGDEQPGDGAGRGGMRATGQQAYAPQPGRFGPAQLVMAALEAGGADLECGGTAGAGLAFQLGDAGRLLSQFGGRDRLGEQQPGERAAPGAQQAVLKRRPKLVRVRCLGGLVEQQAVGDRRDGGPARQFGEPGGQSTAGQQAPSSAGGHGNRHGSVGGRLGAGEGGACRIHVDRARAGGPAPGNGQRPRRGRGAQVVRGDEAGHALPPAGVAGAARGRVEAVELLDAAGVQRAEDHARAPGWAGGSGSMLTRSSSMMPGLHSTGTMTGPPRVDWTSSIAYSGRSCRVRGSTAYS